MKDRTVTLYGIDDHYGDGPVEVVCVEATERENSYKLATRNRAIGDFRSVIAKVDGCLTADDAVSRWIGHLRDNRAGLMDKVQRIDALLARPIVRTTGGK